MNITREKAGEYSLEIPRNSVYKSDTASRELKGGGKRDGDRKIVHIKFCTHLTKHNTRGVTNVIILSLSID